MPPVIPIVAGLAVSAVAGTAWFIGTKAVVALAIMAAASLATKALTPRPSFRVESRDRQQIIRSAVVSRKTVYGRAVVSGPMVYAGSTGAANNVAHLVIPLAGHACAAVEEVWFNERSTTDFDAYVKSRVLWLKRYSFQGPFLSVSITSKRGQTYNYSAATQSGLVSQINAAGVFAAEEHNQYGYDEQGQPYLSDYVVRIEDPQGYYFTTDPAGTLSGVSRLGSSQQPGFRPYNLWVHLGDENQQANEALVEAIPEWTDAHRLRGITYLYVQIIYDADIWPTGLPNVKALVRGKPVFDPRVGQTAWSDNLALCVRDYVLDPVLGMAAREDEIHAASFLAAANISDEWVDTPDGQQRRYTCNGVVDSAHNPADILDGMMTAGAGRWCYVQGQFRLLVGAYVSPTHDIDESWLRGDLMTRPRAARRDLFNAVRGVFVAPENHWQPTDFPPVKNAFYQSQDGELIWRDIDLPFTIDPIAAQRIAKVMLEQARQSIVVELPCNYKALPLAPGDTVRLSIALMGWSHKVFRVESWELDGAGGINLGLREEAPGVYAWNGGEATRVDLAPDTSLADPRVCLPPTGLLLASGTEHLLMAGDGTIVSRIRATWTPPQDGFVVGYELEYRRGTDEYTRMAAGYDQTYIAPVKDGDLYYVRVRAINGLGVKSPWVEQTHAVVGKTAPPSDVTGLVGAVTPDGVLLSWQAVSDLDLSHYEIRAGGSWQGGQVLTKLNATSWLWDYPSLGSVILWVAAVDTSGNVSVAPVFVELSLSGPGAVSGFFAVPQKFGILLSWSAVSGAAGYEIRQGESFDGGALLANAAGTSWMWEIRAAGSYPLWIKAIDARGHLSDVASGTTAVVSGPEQTNVASQILGAELILSWGPVSGQFAVEDYEIRVGDVFATADVVTRTKGLAWVSRVDWAGARTWWVAAIDVAGNMGVPGSVQAPVAPPGAVQSLSAQVIDNYALLRWQPPVMGSLPVAHYRLLKGATLAAAVEIGTVGGTFHTPFESESGTYLYWIVAVDTAGNEGAAASVTAQISQPPDFILRADWKSDFSGTKAAALVTENGLLAPAVTGRTWVQHFTDNDWASPAAQVAAGYPVFIQPAALSGQYQELFDYGTVVPSTRVQLTVQTTSVAAGAYFTPTIELSADGQNWDVFAGAMQAFGNQFRYVRVTLDFVSDGKGMLLVEELRVKLDMKLKNDGGNGVAAAGDSGGTRVYFNVPFLDIESITVSPQGTTALIPVYDFTDVPNPEYFDVYLFTTAGARASAPFSWAAKGM